MPTPSDIGALAELAVATALTKAGCRVYIPFFNGHGRVDLVYETEGGCLRRVQVKSGRVVRGALVFAVASHTGRTEQPYVGDVDEFGVYSKELNAVYLVPIADVPGHLASLRLEPARNNQSRRTRSAEPYLLGPCSL
jgi:hypothetical protein